MNQAEKMWLDLKDRMEFAEEVVVAVKTHDGNFVLATTPEVSEETYKMSMELIEENLIQRGH